MTFIYLSCIYICDQIMCVSNANNLEINLLKQLFICLTNSQKSPFRSNVRHFCTLFAFTVTHISFNIFLVLSNFPFESRDDFQ